MLHVFTHSGFGIGFDYRAGLEPVPTQRLGCRDSHDLACNLFQFSISPCQARERFCCALRSTESPVRRFRRFLQPMSSRKPRHRCTSRDWRFARPTWARGLPGPQPLLRLRDFSRVLVAADMARSRLRFGSRPPAGGCGPCESSCEPSCQGSMSGFTLSQSLAMKAAGAGFLARQEYRSHLDGLRAKSQGGNYTSCISYSPRGNHRHIDNVDDLWDQRQGARKRILRRPEK